MTADIGKNTVDLNIDLFDNAAGSDTQNRRSGRVFINRQQAGIGNRPDRIAGQRILEILLTDCHILSVICGCLRELNGLTAV